MSLQLDERRRAMLGEMGIRVFEPLAERAQPAAPVAPVSVPERTTQPASRVPPAVRPSAMDGGAFEAMDWSALVEAVARQGGTVFGAGHLQPDWLILGDPPDENEEREGVPFAGPPGLLLDNMLKALGLSRSGKVYLTNLMKRRPPGNRNPEPADLAQHEPILRRQVQLLRPRIILVMGRFAVPFLLDTTEPIGKLRGRAHEYLGVPVIATYHPTYLLRSPLYKAQAWADLCLARELLGNQA